jgi:hypothetical protein
LALCISAAFAQEVEESNPIENIDELEESASEVDLAVAETGGAGKAGGFAAGGGAGFKSGAAAGGAAAAKGGAAGGAKAAKGKHRTTRSGKKLISLDN